MGRQDSYGQDVVRPETQWPCLGRGSHRRKGPGCLQRPPGVRPRGAPAPPVQLQATVDIPSRAEGSIGSGCLPGTSGSLGRTVILSLLMLLYVRGAFVFIIDKHGFQSFKVSIQGD